MPKTSARQTSDAFAQSLPFLPFGQQAWLAVARLQAHAFKATMRYQIEMLDFLKHRYEQDIKLAESLVESTQYGDTLDVCSDFYQTAMSEYSSEAGKVANIGSKLASETTREIRREAETITEDMAARTVA